MLNRLYLGEKLGVDEEGGGPCSYIVSSGKMQTKNNAKENSLALHNCFLLPVFFTDLQL